MIELKKQTENSWLVWNTSNNKVADIVKIDEYNAFIKRKPRYRVDVNGFTVESMVENFQTARGIATRYIK